MVNIYPDSFVWYLPELTNALSKTLVDPYAEIKHVNLLIFRHLIAFAIVYAISLKIVLDSIALMSLSHLHSIWVINIPKLEKGHC